MYNTRQEIYDDYTHFVAKATAFHDAAKSSDAERELELASLLKWYNDQVTELENEKLDPEED